MTGPAEQADGTAVPAQRSGRHAAPRTPVRARLRGRALAMAAVPTALLMAAAYTPNPALAESAAGKPCGNAPVAVPDVAPIETPVPKSELPEPPGPSTVPSTAPTQTPTQAPTHTPTQVPTQAPTGAPVQQPTSPVKPPSASTPTTQPPAARSATNGGSVASSAVYPDSSTGTGTVARTGLIDDIVGGINHLLNPNASPSPSASPTAGATATQGTTPAPAPTPAAPAPRAGTPAQPAPAAAGQGAAPTAAQPSGGAPSAAATPTGKASPKATPTAGASGTASPTATPTPTGTPTDNPNCAVDTRSLTAGAAASGQVVPEQNWTLNTSRLALHGAAFHGVYDVKTPTGTKRVLKFVVDSVDIDNLDMSTLEGNGVTFHVQGAPGSTSTMRNGQVTMYVERLTGHLSKVLGLPLPVDLGEITLTPDTLPRWLYDLIGAIPIPLELELTGVTAKQAGQFGGTLHIPGMHLFNDNAPYSDK
ncbi:hypothetical protein BX285_0174 [Streptomyces sp. 1114.5]|uniref:hypothetical protein n=1 Tax=Streptomyces sp. 1114.5 TaxID=1938830 RepID=UPI000EB4D964|nr:hypothetical protein [Streptomyces sp. 1114.5]RKT15851.1 hypothetical protein BX285_0174 [Streptomyces sp. 1114.5]